MAREGIYTAIDLGTTKVCTIIASIRPDGGLLVHGVGIEPSQGMHKGRVVDVERARWAVQMSLDKAQREMGHRVSWAYLGVSGDHITCLNTSEVLQRHRNGSGITRRDLEKLSEAARPQVPPGKELLHQILMDSVVDGLSGVRSPEGLDAEQIELRFHSIMGDAGPLGNIISVVKGCKVSMRDMVLQPLAAGEAVLTEDEQEIGAILLDIGGGTSDLILYRGGNPCYTCVLPVGGFQLTRDVSVALGGTPYSVAEELKVNYGHALPSAVDPDEQVMVPAYPGRPEHPVSRRMISQALHERIVETLELAMAKVRDAGLRELPPGGLVLTGGSAEIPGLEDAARRVVRGPVRIAAPRGIPGLPSSLRSPAYSASVGILLWGIKHQGERRTYHESQRAAGGMPSLLRRLLSIFKR